MKIQRECSWGWGTKGKKFVWIERKIHVLLEKLEGLIIKDLKLFNEALLSKWKCILTTKEGRYMERDF